MIQSFSDFIPNLSQKTFKLRQLTKKHVHFCRKKCQQLEFDNLRNALHKNTILTFFQPQQPTFLYADAHITVLSATLLQGTTIVCAKPGAFSSRAVTLVSNMCQYLIGGPRVIIITDHKLVFALFSNNHHGSIRTDCIKLCHQDLYYKVVWRQGSLNPSDYLPHPLITCHVKFVNKPMNMPKLWFLHYTPYTYWYWICQYPKENRFQTSWSYQGYILKSASSLTSFWKIFDELTIQMRV